MEAYFIHGVTSQAISPTAANTVNTYFAKIYRSYSQLKSNLHKNPIEIEHGIAKIIQWLIVGYFTR